jgi:nitrite reductase (NO-forming)
MKTMKKISNIKFIAIGLLAFMVSCRGDEERIETPTAAETEQSEPIKNKPEMEEVIGGDGLETRIAKGKVLYEKVCQACHQADGKGLPGAFPPIAQSDYLNADLTRAIAGVVNGLEGEITVNGEKYNQVMPKTDMTDAEIADVFTYVLNSFGNKGGEVIEAEVANTRK